MEEQKMFKVSFCEKVDYYFFLIQSSLFSIRKE